MNTYDFDETIFRTDSSVAFVLFCAVRYPAAVLRAFPGMLSMGIRYLAKRADTKALKERVFGFLRYLDDVDGAVEEFWEKNISGLERWYLEQKREDDIIISASPEFLLRPVARQLGVGLIGTRMNKHTGVIEGKNCHDSEKVRRFYEAYPGAHTENFYSDSLSDSPMAEIAERAFMVDRGCLSPWPGK